MSTSRIHRPIPWGLCLAALGLGLLAACAEEPGERAAPGTGSLVARIQWPADAAPSGSAGRQAAPAGVVTVRATVSNLYPVRFPTPVTQDFPATPGQDGNGVISGIPVENDFVLVLQGLDAAGGVLFRGDAGNLNVTAGATTDAGIVKMFTPIADANLQKCLDGQGQALSTITSLECQNRGIVSLTGIEALTGLSSAQFSTNNISDLRPLSGLSLLAFLNLDNSASLSDLSPLAALTALGQLSIQRAGVSDLSPLAGLTGLAELNMSEISISSFASISGITSLTTLTAERITTVTSAAPLATLTKLTLLDISGTGIADLTPLQALTVLTSLDVSFTPTTNVAPLATLTGLVTLDMSEMGSGNPVSGVASLTTLTSASTINLRGANVTPCSDLATLEAALGPNKVQRPTSCP